MLSIMDKKDYEDLILKGNK